MCRPYIVFHVTASVDGRISFGPNFDMFQDIEESKKYISHESVIYAEAEKWLRALHNPQADMLGSNSIVRENDKLKELPRYEGKTEELLQDYLPEDVVDRPDRKGWLIVVDGRGRLRSGYKGNEGWHMLHLVSNAVASEYLAFLQNKRIPYIITGKEKVDLKKAMEKLRRKLNVKTVFSTAAGKLGGAMLQAGLIDEISIVTHPNIIGGFNTPCLFDSPAGEPPVKLELITAQVEPKGFLWVRYRVAESECIDLEHRD